VDYKLNHKLKDMRLMMDKRRLQSAASKALLLNKNNNSAADYKDIKLQGSHIKLQGSIPLPSEKEDTEDNAEDNKTEESSYYFPLTTRISTSKVMMGTGKLASSVNMFSSSVRTSKDRFTDALQRASLQVHQEATQKLLLARQQLEAERNSLRALAQQRIKEHEQTGVPDFVQPITSFRVWQVEILGSEGPQLKAVGANCNWPIRAALHAKCDKVISNSASAGFFPQFAHQFFRGLWPQWKPGNEEEYRFFNHSSPHWDCSCGIWSFKRPMDLYQAAMSYYPMVWGTVHTWGRIIETENGYRSEYAYPARLFTLNGETVARALEKAYHVPVEAVKDSNVASAVGYLLLEDKLLNSNIEPTNY
jgi:hypothetical protein